MAMRRVGLVLLATGFWALIGSSTVRADNDTIRLGSSASGAIANVDNDGDTDLVVWRGGYRHGGGYGYRGGYGGYRGGYYGGYRGYGYGGYAGYRGGYYGGYRGYGYGGGYGYGYGGYASYYGGGYYGGGYYGGYRPYYHHHHHHPYHWRISYSVPSSYYICTTQDTLVPAPVYVAPVLQSQYLQPQVLPTPNAVPAPNGNQTYPYDGGPPAPVPVPGQADPTPAAQPTVPLTGKIVSLPRESTSGSTQYTTHLVSSPAQPAATSSYSYPAYGEQSLPSVRKSK